MPRQTKEQREAAKSLAQQRMQLVDEFGRLDAELVPVRGKQRRLEELSRLIKSWHADADPANSVSSTGRQYEVVLGPAGMQTRISDMTALYQAMGHGKFLAFASVTLKALEQSGVDPAAVASLTIKERTGTRPVVVRTLS